MFDLTMGTRHPAVTIRGVMIVILALAAWFVFAPTASAQIGHGAAVLKNCSPKCFCGDPSDCDDGNPCTEDICDPDGLGNVMECIIIVFNIDQFGDTISVTNAFDVIDQTGNGGIGPLLVSREGVQPGGAPGSETPPATFTLDIIATAGDTTCTPGVEQPLPCDLAPGASVTFVQDIFPISDKYCSPLPGMVLPSALPCDDDSDCAFGTCVPLIGTEIPDEGGVVTLDLCDGIFDETCSGPGQGTQTQTTPIAECCENPCDPFDEQGIPKPECVLTIGDFVWDDTDADGCQTGESANGLDQIPVQLQECSGALRDTCFQGPSTVGPCLTSTNPTGFYEFHLVDTLCEQNQAEARVFIDGPDGYLPSPEDDVCEEPTDSNDSDCDPNGFTDCNLYDYGDADPTIDCGFFQPECEVFLDECVAVDTNGDGFFDDETCFGVDVECDSEPCDLYAVGLNIPLDAECTKDIEWRIKVKNDGDFPVGGCTVEFDGGVVAEGLTIPPGGTYIDIDPIAGGECDFSAFLTKTATVTCNECNEIPIAESVTDSDNATVKCFECGAELTKEVACDDPLFEDFGEGCISWLNKDDVRYQFEIQNTGEVDLLCSFEDVTLGLSQGDVSVGVGQSNPVSPVAPVDEFCDEAQIENTAQIDCACLATADGVPLNPADQGLDFGECFVMDDDSTLVQCLLAEVEIQKTCDAQEGETSHVTIDVTNTGETTLENCVVTDQWYEGPCDAAGEPTSGVLIDEHVDQSLVSLPPTGVAETLEFDIQGLVANACNVVEVVCEIPDTIGPKTVMDRAGDTCEVCDVFLDECVAVDTNGDGFFDDEICFGQDVECDSEPCDLYAVGLNIPGDAECTKDIEWRIKVCNPSDLTTVDGCSVEYDGQPPLSLPSIPPGECVELDPIAGGECDFSAFLTQTATVSCNVCDDATIEIPETDSDNATVKCFECGAELTKEVACDDPLFDDFGEGCTSWLDMDDVRYRFQIQNTGEVDLVCDFDDRILGLGIDDIGVGVIQGNPYDLPTEDQLCDAERIENTAEIDCTCVATADGVGLNPNDQTLDFGECSVMDDDSTVVECLLVDLEVTKTCEDAVDGLSHVTIDVTNTGQADLVNCVATDQWFEGPCDAAGEPTSDVLLGEYIPDPFDLPADGPAVALEFDILDLQGNACNVVEVVCEIPETVGPKTISERATDECPVAPCELDVTKLCCVVPPPPPVTGTDCDGKITALKLEYTDDDCSVNTNSQEGKATCSGSNAGSGPVRFVVSDNRGDLIFADEIVWKGDVVVALASEADEDEFKSETMVTIDDGVQVVKFHTSCSKPIKVGDQWGSVRIVELTSTDGGTVTLPDDPDPNETLCVPPAPPGPPHCQGKVVEAVFRYTGGSCADSDNTQGSKFSCSGVLNGEEPVDIMVTSDVTAVMVDPYEHVLLGTDVRFTATGNELKSSLQFSILRSGAVPEDELPDDLLQELNIHTSCSAPLNLGDVFGGMRLVELTTTEGGTVTEEPPEPPEPTSDCVIPPPVPFRCDNKIGAINVIYRGGDCGETNNPQEGAVECNDYGFIAPVEPVQIRLFKDDDEVYLDTGSPASIHLDDSADATAANAGRTEFASNTFAEIYDDDGNLIQDLEFHTSCSKPIDIGDRFGALEIGGLTDKDGVGSAAGALVEYSYEITNPGSFDVTNVEATDDKLGPITKEPIPSIAGGDTVVLRKTAVIEDATTNTVTVTYNQGAVECPAEEAIANVTVGEGDDDEDGDDVECTSKVQAMLLEYRGEDVLGSVTVSIEADKFRNEPVVYDFPKGLPFGTMLALPSENDSTIDATVHDETELGSKTSLYINGRKETIHTSCSTPFRAGYPAPLDDPKGDPSDLWFVVGFRQK